MRTLEDWLVEYSESHQNKLNKLIHVTCVPVIEFSILGILWLIPTPSSFWSIPCLNWATVIFVVMMIFYASLKSFKYFIGSFITLMIMMSIIYYLQKVYGGIIIYSFLGLFVTAWIGQFIGHRIEGKKPSFFKDLLFLLIGPLWVLKYFYDKTGMTRTI